MALIYDVAKLMEQGQNIRPPRGSWFNGEGYWLKLYPEVGRKDRSVLVITMRLQFQFSDDGPGGAWTGGEKTDFAQKFVAAVKGSWDEKFRITTTSTVVVEHARDVGVIFDFPYYIDGWHTDEHFEIGVAKHAPDAAWKVSSCGYSSGETTLDSNDLRPETKGASMKQRDAVHEFGHMLGLRDEYTAATVDRNPNHLSDVDSMMNVGEAVRERHYAPFAGWLTKKFETLANLAKSPIDYKVEGRTDMSNALL